MSDAAATMSDDQQHSMVNFLRFAAEKYRDNARTLMEMMAGDSSEARPGNQFAELAQQFERQADEAAGFADMFENAREIVITPGHDDDAEMAETVGASFRP